MPIRNITCVKRHCSSELAACLADDLCKQNFNCCGQCDGDSTCLFYCSESYKSDTQDALSYCMIDQNGCFDLPPPDPINNATCRDPADAVVPGLDKQMLEGEWYVVAGLNQEYDCFGCQIQDFEFSGLRAVDYQATYNLIAVNGTLIWNHVEMLGSEETPGIMTLHGHDSGHDDTQYWYFLLQEDDTAFIYYCGSILTWHFEGGLVLSRNTYFNSQYTEAIQQKLDVLGLGYSDLCVLDPQDECYGAPVVA